MRVIAVDTNLMILLVVGSCSRSLIAVHKRLTAYSNADFDLLLGMISTYDKIVVTPNALTEVSNLLGYGVVEPYRTSLYKRLKVIAEQADERYEPSRFVVAEPEYPRIGIADCAWLRCLDLKVELLTDDVHLYLAAMGRGLVAYNFNHFREQRGTV